MKKVLSSALLLVALALTSCSDRQTPSAPENNSGATQLSEMQTRSEAFRAKTKNLKAELRVYADKATSRSVKLDKKKSTNKITVPDDYATIQEAVDAAAPGTKIKVKTGVYTENVEISTAHLTLTTEGDVTVDGSIFVFDTKGVEIENFKVVTGQGFTVALFPFSSGIMIFNCEGVKIHDNHVSATGDVGIACVESRDGLVKGNTTENILFPGIFLFLSSEYDVQENVSTGNNWGVLLYSSSNNEVAENQCNLNRFSGIELGFGPILVGSHNNEVGDNTCNENGFAGISLASSNNNTIGSDNEANNNTSYGIYLYEGSSDNEIKKNEATGNGTCDIFNDVTAGPGNTVKKNDAGCVSGF